MTETASKTQVFLARLAVALVVALVVVGIGWYGVSSDVRLRIWHNILARPGGSMTFRFLLQPAMAILAALHDGIKDARTGRTPYMWSIVTNQPERSKRLHEGLISTARIILLGLTMDLIYQVVELGMFFPVEAVIVALALAFLPYLLLRGPISRVARWWRGDARVAEVR